MRTYFIVEEILYGKADVCTAIGSTSARGLMAESILVGSAFELIMNCKSLNDLQLD